MEKSSLQTPKTRGNNLIINKEEYSITATGIQMEINKITKCIAQYNITIHSPKEKITCSIHMYLPEEGVYRITIVAKIPEDITHIRKFILEQ